MAQPIIYLYFLPLAFMCAWTALPALRRLLPAPSVIDSPGGPVVFFFLAACCLALIGVTGLLKGADYTGMLMVLDRQNADSDRVDLALLAYLFGGFGVVWALLRRRRG